jgi:hypothetical protein
VLRLLDPRYQHLLLIVSHKPSDCWITLTSVTICAPNLKAVLRKRFERFE